MKRIFRVLTLILILTLKGCNESRILEQDTKEVGLSNYKVSYKYLNADYFEEGYLFEPLYFKDDELYGITNFYPIQGTVKVEDNLLYKIDINGNFKEYENETITKYLEDWQIKDRIEDKNIYIRGMHTKDINYYYSDFKNEELKSLPWIDEYFERIKENKSKIEIKHDKITSFETHFKDNGLIIYEFNSKASYDLEDESIKEILNYKFTYYIDIENEVIYISDVIEEDPSINYYYNREEESFIKINKDGTSKKLIFEGEKIVFEDYEIDLQYVLKEHTDTPYYSYREYNLKDYVVIEFLENRSIYNSIIINKKTNLSRIYKEDKNLENSYIRLSTYIPNSNYFLSIDKDSKGYIGVINEDLNLELISEVDLNLEIYSEGNGGFIFSIEANEEGNKALITIYGTNQENANNYYYKNIQYIYLDIDERE